MDFLTLVGYFIAALAIAYGLYLILRKNVVKDDDTDPAIDRVQWVILVKEQRRCQADDTQHLVFIHPAGDQFAAR